MRTRAASQGPATDPSRDQLTALAVQFSPLLQLAAGEAFLPSSIDYFLPNVYLMNENGQVETVTARVLKQ